MTSKRREEKKKISRERFEAIFNKPKAPKGPKMSDIMGGARGPKGPLGGQLDSPKAAVKKKKVKKYDPTKANRAGQKMGQRKAGGQIKKMAYGGMAKKKMMGGGMAMKYGHGGTVAKGKKCPRDGIAMQGKTKAGRKTT